MVLNVVVLGSLVGFTAYQQSVIGWFDRRVETDEELNASMYGRILPAPPERISLVFEPQDAARSLYVLLSYTSATSEFAAIRLSAIDGLPTAFIRFADGWQTEVRPLDVAGAAFEALSLDIVWTEDRLRASVNGGTPLDVALPRSGASLDLAAYPTHLFQWPRPQLVALRSLQVEVLDESGNRRVLAFPSRRRHALWALAAIAAFALLYVAGDRLLARLCSGPSRIAALLRTVTAWPIGVLFALPMLFTLYELSRRGDLSKTWFSEFVVDGHFDQAAFSRSPILRQGHEHVEISPDPSVAKVMAFGGSTTQGFPYRRGTWDWPTQLQRLLDADTVRGGPRFQVVNLGFDGSNLEDNFPPFAGSFLEAVRPRIVILNVLINDYFQQSGPTNLGYFFGLWRLRSPDRPGTRQDYAARLGQVIALCRAVGARVILVSPPVDSRYFEGNPLVEWQRTERDVAAEQGATLVSLQDEFAHLDQRFIFYEFMHPNRLGYRLMAEKIYKAVAGLTPLDPATSALAPGAAADPTL